MSTRSLYPTCALACALALAQMPGLAQTQAQASAPAAATTTVEGIAFDREVTLPGEGTVVTINGQQVAKVSEPEFFTCLMYNYFGDKPADAKLKLALLGGH